jgi:hypothetical protein
MYNYCKLCEYWVSGIDTQKLSPKVRYSEPDITQVLIISPGIGYIVNQANHNKNLVLSIIEFLRDWMVVHDENEKKHI